MNKIELEKLSTEDLAKLQSTVTKELTKRKTEASLKVDSNWADSPVGLWKITTEGDCEGRTIDHIATEEGHIGDLALKYAGYAMYQLNFTKAYGTPRPPKERNQVMISLDIKSKTWDMNKEQRAAAIQKFLGPNFVVSPTTYYAAVEIKRK